MVEEKKILRNKMETITCAHCNKKIKSPALLGLTLVCPYCKKSVNGQYYHEYSREKSKKEENED